MAPRDKTQSSTLIIEVGGTFVVKEFVVVFFLDFLWHVIDPPLLVLLCFCVLRFCRRPRPIIITSSSSIIPAATKNISNSGYFS